LKESEEKMTADYLQERDDRKAAERERDALRKRVGGVADALLDGAGAQMGAATAGRLLRNALAATEKGET
jgi:hypothetical protein